MDSLNSSKTDLFVSANKCEKQQKNTALSFVYEFYKGCHPPPLQLQEMKVKSFEK